MYELQTLYADSSTTDTPEILVIGGVHGDEPSGVNAVNKVYDWLSSSDITVHKNIGFVIANPNAVEQNVRYIDIDLNRNFLGDYDSEHLESQIAAELHSLIETAEIVLSLHSTHSSTEPFGITHMNPKRDVLKAALDLPITKVVRESEGMAAGNMVSYPNVLEIESGYQHSKRAKSNAIEITKQFLESTGGITAGRTTREQIQTDCVVYELQEKVAKQGQISLFVDNFEEVDANEVYAVDKHKDENGETTTEYTSTYRFTPVLMSERGYQNTLGFKSKRMGWISNIYQVNI